MDARVTSAGGVELTAIVYERLGNWRYLVGLGDGSALVVGPPPDFRALRPAAERARTGIRFVADAHLHANFLSGAVQLARDDDVTILASSAGGLPRLSPDDVAEPVDNRALAVDTRPLLDFTRAHLPGALSISLRSQFATWLGWLVPAVISIVVVRSPDQDLAELVWRSWNIGVEARLVGELVDCVEAWPADGRPASSTERPALGTSARGAGYPISVRTPSSRTGTYVVPCTSNRRPSFRLHQTCRQGRRWSCAVTGNGQ